MGRYEGKRSGFYYVTIKQLSRTDSGKAEGSGALYKRGTRKDDGIKAWLLQAESYSLYTVANSVRSKLNIYIRI